jgi:hypothetical protein
MVSLRVILSVDSSAIEYVSPERFYSFYAEMLEEHECTKTII